MKVLQSQNPKNFANDFCQFVRTGARSKITRVSSDGRDPSDLRTRPSSDPPRHIRSGPN